MFDFHRVDRDLIAGPGGSFEPQEVVPWVVSWDFGVKLICFHSLPLAIILYFTFVAKQYHQNIVILNECQEGSELPNWYGQALVTTLF